MSDAPRENATDDINAANAGIIQQRIKEAEARTDLTPYQKTLFIMFGNIPAAGSAKTEQTLESMIVQLKAMLDSLTPREREIIELRYGLRGDGTSYSRDETAKHMKSTPDEITAVEYGAVRKLMDSPPQ